LWFLSVPSSSANLPLHQSPLAPTPPTSPSPVYPLPALSLTFIVPLALLLSPPSPVPSPVDSSTGFPN
jgi:hypothetical protein